MTLTGMPNAEYLEWTPDTTGVWQFSTCAMAGYDTLLGLYDVGCGTELSCNDDGGACAGFTSVMSSAGLISGTSYIIQLGGFQDENGTGTLDISFLGASPSNDLCANAIPMASGLTSIAFDSTNAANDGPAPGCGTAFTNPNDIWYTWSPAVNGDYQFSTIAATFPTRVAVSTSCGGTILGCNANGGDAQLNLYGLLAANTYTIQLSGEGTETGTGMLATSVAPPLQPGEQCTNAVALAVPSTTPFDTTLAVNEGVTNSCAVPAPTDIWYSFTTDPVGGTHIITTCASGYDTRLTLWDACGGTEIGCNDDDCGFQSTITACNLTPNTTYLLQVGGFQAATVGTGILDISAAGVPVPANDECANATVLPDGAVVSLAVDTTGSCNSGPQPSCASGFDTPNDTFYEWSPDADDTWTFTTTGSSFDSRLTIFDSFGGTELGCNLGTPDAIVSISGLLDASTYIIMVSGDGSTTGTTMLDISPFIPPPGNDCAGAVLLPAGAQVGVPSDTRLASASGQTSSCTFPAPVDLWYRWSPLATGDYNFTTCDSANYDTVLTLFTACGGTELGCNDDDANCMAQTSQLLVPNLIAGTEYYLQVGGFFTAVGTSVLDIESVIGPMVGTNYCPLTPNSAGAGTVITGSGSASVGANDLVLEAFAGPGSQPGVFFYGPGQIQVPFGEGNRCAGGSVVRLWPPILASPAGISMRAVDNTNSAIATSASPIVVGGTQNFQYWHRDPAGGPSGFNLSNALEIVFGP